MYVYELKIGISADVIADNLFIQAASFRAATLQAYKIFDREQYSEKDIVSLALIGEIEKVK